MTRRRGACLPRSASAEDTASNSAAGSVGSSCSVPSASIRWDGNSLAIAGLDSTRAVATPVSSTASRPKASLNARYGSALSPKSRQWPTRTRQPARCTSALNSVMRRLFADPGITTQEHVATDLVGPEAHEIG